MSSSRVLTGVVDLAPREPASDEECWREVDPGEEREASGEASRRCESDDERLGSPGW